MSPHRPCRRDDPDRQKRAALGYLRVPLSMSDQDIERMRKDLACYAENNGLTLLRILVDRDPSHTVGFARLISALKRGDADVVVVPALHHFGHFSGVRLAMRDLLESHTGARVYAVYSDLAEWA